MFKILLFALVGLVIAGSAAILAGLPQRVFDREKTGLDRVWTKPWIEVLRPRVEERDPQRGAVRALRTGDEIEVGRTIALDSKGRANLYFPDGSVLRLDSGSEIRIENAEFDGATERSAARIMLSAGRIWSKVLFLATPDSVWEVRTSNAVVTVRGTAFGVFFKDGKTSVVGSESAVKVAAVDPSTGEVFEAAAALIEPGKIVEIGAAEVEAIKEDQAALTAEAAPPEVLTDEWIVESKRADEEYDLRLEELKDQGLEGQDLREEFREEIRGDLREKMEKDDSERGGFQDSTPVGEEPDGLKPKGIRDEAEDPRKQASEEPPLDTAKESGVPEKERLSPSAPSAPSEPIQRTTVAARPVSLSVKAAIPLEKVIEGVRIRLTATLVFSDGTSRDVTQEAKWSVHGDIGKIEKPGVFFATLGPSVSELGTAPGAVSAVWQDSRSGATILGKTPIFDVEAATESVIDTRG